MIIDNLDDVEYNIQLAILANKSITKSGIVINSDTLESTFSSCIYYETERLQCCSIINKLAQNQSFEDGNKRTAFLMLLYYNENYNLGLLKKSDLEYGNIILDIAVNHWSPEKTCKILFGKMK